MATVSLWSFLIILVLLLIPYILGLNRLLTLCDAPTPSSLSGVSPNFRPSSLTSSSTAPLSSWRALLRAQHGRILRVLPSSSALVPPLEGDPPLPQFTYAFGLLMHVPPHLGDVLELSSHPHSLLDLLLTIEPRTLSSLTRWHPLIHAFAAVGGEETTAESFPTHRIARYFDEVEGVGEFDTVVVHDAVMAVPDRLSFLRRLKRLLRPGGRLILTAPLDRSPSSSTNFSSSDRTALSPDDPLALSDLSAFLPSLRVDYQAEEGLYKRVKDELPWLEWPQKPLPRIFLVATHDDATAGKRRLAEPFHPDFYLTWSTNPLMPWRLAVIDSIFRHHPDARVHVYSDELAKDPSPFNVFTKAGYSVEAVPCDYEEIFSGTPILPWIRNPVNRQKANFVSDALRLALVWKKGGVYLDFDAIVLKPVDQLRNVLARELRNAMVNGAILPFDRAHPFLRLLMILFPKRVRLEAYTSGGPSLQTHGMHLYSAMLPDLTIDIESPPPRIEGGVVEEEVVGSFHVYQPPAFFANSWMEADHYRYWLPEQFPAALYDKMKEEQYIFHIWKQMLGGTLDSQTDYVHLNSFMGRLFLDNCKVLCEVHKESNTNPNLVTIPPPPKPKQG